MQERQQFLESIAAGLADAESGLRERVVDSYRLVCCRTPEAVEVLTVFEGHRLPRADELTTDE